MNDLFGFDPFAAEQTAKKQTENTTEDVLQPLERQGLCKIIGRWEPNQTYSVRFLPPFSKIDNSFFIPIKAHYLNYGDPVLCPSMYGQECPACNTAWTYYKKGIPSNEQHPAWNGLLAQEAYYWPCLHVNGKYPEEIHLARVAKSLHCKNLWRGTIQNTYVIGSVQQALTDYIIECKKKGTLPPEFSNVEPHPLYFLLSSKLGRLVKISRQGEKLATTYSAHIDSINDAYPISEEIVAKNKNWPEIIKEVMWDNFDHANFAHRIQATEDFYNRGKDIPSDLDDSCHSETFDMGKVKEAAEKMDEIDQSNNDDIPFDTTEPEPKPEPPKKEPKKETPKKESKKEATGEVKLTSFDRLVMVKLSAEINGKSRSEVVSDFVKNNPDVSQSYFEQFSEIQQSSLPENEKSAKRTELQNEYKELILA